MTRTMAHKNTLKEQRVENEWGAGRYHRQMMHNHALHIYIQRAGIINRVSEVKGERIWIF